MTASLPSWARSGAYVPVVASFDTRASSVVGAYNYGWLAGGSMNTASYVVTFASTSGTFSGQFGAHYIGLNPTDSSEPSSYGLAATGLMLWSIPVSERYDNGVPVVALNFYGALAPTGLVAGPRNSFTLPVPIGVGFSVSPLPWLSLTPWVEVAPSLNAYNEFQSVTLSSEDVQGYLNADGSLSITEEDVTNLLLQTVSLEVNFTPPVRAGIELSAHLSRRLDLNLNASIGSTGTFLGGDSIAFVGGSLQFHWDEIVPSVLPPETANTLERCEAAAKMCHLVPESSKPIKTTPMPAAGAKKEPTQPSSAEAGATDGSATASGTANGGAVIAGAAAGAATAGTAAAFADAPEKDAANKSATAKDEAIQAEAVAPAAEKVPAPEKAESKPVEKAKPSPESDSKSLPSRSDPYAPQKAGSPTATFE